MIGNFDKRTHGINVELIHQVLDQIGCSKARDEFRQILLVLEDSVIVLICLAHGMMM